MANHQSPPATTQTLEKVISAGTSSLNSIRVTWIQDIEEPPSFGTTQQSVESDMTCG